MSNNNDDKNDDLRIEEIKKTSHNLTQQSRKLDLLLAKADRQSEKLKQLQDSKQSKNGYKPKTSQM